MEAHYNLSDKEFEVQFTKGVLDSGIFSHEAHLRLAWIHISNYGVAIAIENITSQLQNYTRSLGAFDKYNKTVTVAAIMAVHHFMVRSSKTNFKEFIEENQRLKTHFKELLSHHYNFDVFKSTEAKTEYLEPDLLPFD